MIGINWDRAEAFARGETLEANRDEKREVAYFLMAHGYKVAAVAQHVRCTESTVRTWGREWGLIREPSRTPGVLTAPTWRTQCGTAAGYMAHHRAGERYCDRCRAANAAKSRKR